MYASKTRDMFFRLGTPPHVQSFSSLLKTLHLILYCNVSVPNLKLLKDYSQESFIPFLGIVNGSVLVLQSEVVSWFNEQYLAALIPSLQNIDSNITLMISN